MYSSITQIIAGIGLLDAEFREVCTHHPDTFWDGEIDRSKWEMLSKTNPAIFYFFETMAVDENSGITLNMLVKTGVERFSLKYALEVFKVYRSILANGEKVIKILGSNQNLSLTPFKSPLSHDNSY
jgi:hypothetical protein